MKSAAALLALIGFVSVSQVLGGAITDVAGTITIGGTVVISCKTDANVPTDGTLTITADRPIFAKGVTTNADKITSATNPVKVNTHTAGTNAAGTVLTLTATTAPLVADGAVKVFTFATGVLETAANGLIPGTVGITVSATGGGAPTTSGKIQAAIFPASDTATSFAIGIPTMATSNVKALAPGDYTFTFFPYAEIASASTLTISADTAIFTASAASASAPIKVFTTTVTAAASSTTAIAGSTCVTDSTGKILTITLGAALPALQLVTLTMQTVMANNPASPGMVKLTIDASAGTTTATSIDYPIFNLANEVLFVGAAIDASKQVKALTSTAMELTIVPQVKVAAGEKVTFTASASVFTGVATPACGAVGGVAGATSVVAAGTCATTATTLIYTVAANYEIEPKVFTTIKVTANIAANGAAAADITFKVDADSADNVASSTIYGYAIFDAATTSQWTSGLVTPLSATSTPTSLVVKFKPQNAVPATGTVQVTASAAIFTASATGTVTCATNVDHARLAAKAVSCTSATDSTGKILTVTVAAANSFLQAQGASITLTDKLLANAASGTAVTFGFETSTDTTALAAQTGYTTTAAPPAPPSNSSGSASATGTTTTVTQVYTFASLTVAAYTGKMKSNCECAYANTVGGATTPLWCTATTSAYNYVSGVTMSSTVAARRAAKVTFVLAVKSSVKSTAQLQTLVASGSTATAFATALTAVNTASNYTATPGTATVATATFTGGSSSASTLLPSMLSLVAAIFVAARQ